jgi:HK97 family phage prohead protease
MERRYSNLRALPLKLEKRADGELPTIIGYGAVFYDPTDAGTEYNFSGWWDEFAERIMPACFDQALTRDDVRGLFNHDANCVLGRSTAGTMKLSVDKIGLRYEITPPPSSIGRDVIASIERGDISGSSFSFDPEEVVYREVKQPDGEMLVVRELHRVKLYDVGPVTFPAYTSTTTGVRAASVRAAEELAAAKTGYEEWKKKTAPTWPQRAMARARAIACND